MAGGLVASASLHFIAALVVAVLPSASRPLASAVAHSDAERTIDDAEIRHIVFLTPGRQPSSGGGGGGNRQPAPIRRAEGVGMDAMTVRIAKPIATTGVAIDETPLPSVVLDARPLASGSAERVGLPVGGMSFGTSTGPGSGGGVGDGTGTGIGSGRGPGVGPGSGGGTGGGVYRVGGAVTAPKVITEVPATYSPDALEQRVQGTVVIELIVQANGEPRNLRLLQMLDRSLDERSLDAARRWRFEPGRLAGRPVDVVVTIMFDFTIR